MRVHLLTSNQQWRFGTSSVEEVAEVDDRVAEDLIAQGIAKRADEAPAGDPPSDDLPPDPPSDDLPVAPEVEVATAPAPAEVEAEREGGPRRRRS